MHPFVHLHDPKGHCPICGMNLVPVFKRDAASTHSAVSQDVPPGPPEFTVPVERQQQIGVTYATVTRERLSREVRAVGVVVPDRTRHWEFVARVDGYVQTLHVTSPGELVEKDQPLLTLYSPDLLTAERELVELLRMRDGARSSEARRTAQELIDSAQRRLVQWNVTPAQIGALERTRQPGEYLTLLSPFQGIVEAVPVDQGRNVKVGDHLVDVADLSNVWVWADVYENELSLFRLGQKVALTTTAYPGRKFEGKIALINPFLDEVQRTAKIRIDIPNADFRLRPGMYVNAILGTGVEREALTIPVSAVMPTGTRNLVFVDKTQGRLEPRAVLLGEKYGDRYAVKEGLTEGERVVASANFLIDAEANVQGALKSFDEPPTADARPEALP
jgi:RND family efflux transporter MFP subunit